MLDGLEVTQFTYFQQCGGVDLDPISAELTYGLERLCAFLQDVDSIYDIVWARDPDTGREVKYGEVRLADEQQFSVYNFEAADVAGPGSTSNCARRNAKRCSIAMPRLSKEGKDLLRSSEDDGIAREKSRFPLAGAYDLCLKCSHYFNILDARGAISVTERVGVIARVRALAVGIAKAWMDQQNRRPRTRLRAGIKQCKAGRTKEKKGKLAPVGSRDIEPMPAVTSAHIHGVVIF